MVKSPCVHTSCLGMVIIKSIVLPPKHPIIEKARSLVPIYTAAFAVWFTLEPIVLIIINVF